MQYANRFTPVEQEKLAVATSQFVSTGLTSANVLTILKKDHVVKDCTLPPSLVPSLALFWDLTLSLLSLRPHAATSVTFLTTFFKTFLLTESLESLSSILRKGGVTDLEAFFPPNKQNATELSTHFKSAGLTGVVEFYLKQKTSQAKEDLLARLKELVAEEADFDEVRFELSDSLNLFVTKLSLVLSCLSAL